MTTIFKFIKLILFAIIFCSFISVGECREIVFVVNSSRSMSAADPFREIAESVTWSVENLSADDEVGIVTFNDTARILRPLTKVNSVPNKIFNLNYSGGSDAGAGILTAIDMLTPKFNTDRDIIFITNGEFKDAQSSKNFKAGLEQAKWLGFTVYLVDIRHNVDPTTYQLYDGYAKFLPINYHETMTTLRTILQGDLHTPHIELPTNNLTTGTINFTVPLQSACRLKICLLSSNVGTAQLENVQVNSTIQGHFIKIFDVTPTTNQFALNVNFPQGTGLTLDVIPTVEGNLQTEVKPHFLIKNFLEITPVYPNSPNTKILADKIFDDKLINLQIDSKKIEGKIHNGSIQVAADDLGENISLEKIHFEDVGIIFDGNDTAQIVVPKNYYLAGLLALLGLLIIGGLVWRIRKKKQDAQAENLRALFGETKNVPPTEDFYKVVKNSKFSYSGKLMIYVTKTREDENIAPREFNLFRMNSAQVNLSQILSQCNIDVNFKDAEKIFINPEQNCIRLDNKSDCTITKRNNLVKKGGRVEMYYNDSINISTEDEAAEMILVYKSLRPN